MIGSMEMERVDVRLHAKVCLQFFGRLQHLQSSTAIDGLPVQVAEALKNVYGDASSFLQSLVISHSLDNLYPLVRFMDIHHEASRVSDLQGVSSFSSSAVSVVQDLIMVTSFLCMEAMDMTKKSKCSADHPSNGRSGRLYSTSVITALMALAPYWAAASSISQVKADSDHARNHGLRTALTHLLQFPKIAEGCAEISDEILQLFNIVEGRLTPRPSPPSPLPSDRDDTASTNSITAQLIERLRKALRSHLHSPLLFAIVLSLSLRTDLAAKLTPVLASLSTSTAPTPVAEANRAAIEQMLTLSDENSFRLVEVMVTQAPRLVLRTDLTSLQLSPLSYIVGHRLQTSDAILSSFNLIACLVRCITDHVPSALSSADSKGLYPLHYAARRGYSDVLRFLATRYGSFSLYLMDHSGKYPLHHALLSHSLHSEDVLVELASLCPSVLLNNNAQQVPVPDNERSESTAFHPLQFAAKVSRSLHSRLLTIAEEYQLQHGVSVAPSSNVSVGSVTSTESLDQDDLPPADTTTSNGSANTLQYYAQSLLMLQHAHSGDESTSVSGKKRCRSEVAEHSTVEILDDALQASSVLTSPPLSTSNTTAHCAPVVTTAALTAAVKRRRSQGSR